MADNKSIVKVNIRNHEVTIEDELIVKIRHREDCSNPCSEIRNIVMYLEAELFVAEGFVITNNR